MLSIKRTIKRTVKLTTKRPINQQGIQAMGSKKASAGFTLIEAMIVVAVIGILTAIAMPMYQDSMRKSRRADAMRDLMELASRQERFYAQNGVYTNNVDGEFGLNWVGTESGEGNYNLSVIQCEDTGGALVSLDNCYVLQAIPKPGTDQVNDTNCATLSVNTLGERKSSGTLDEDDCW